MTNEEKVIAARFAKRNEEGAAKVEQTYTSRADWAEYYRRNPGLRDSFVPPRDRPAKEWVAAAEAHIRSLVGAELAAARDRARAAQLAEVALREAQAQAHTAAAEAQQRRRQEISARYALPEPDIETAMALVGHGAATALSGGYSAMYTEIWAAE